MASFEFSDTTPSRLSAACPPLWRRLTSDDSMLIWLRTTPIRQRRATCGGFLTGAAPDALLNKRGHLSVTPIFGTPNVTLLYQIQAFRPPDSH
jgi:hypothetical protein